MRTFENATNPPLDATLEHFGVKGMHWGVRKSVSGSQIRSARRSVTKSKMAVQDARDKVRAGTAPKSSLAKAKLAHLNNPDRVTANRMTVGEHALAAVFLTPAGFAGVVAGTQIKSRVIEARQVNKDYNRVANNRTHNQRMAARAAS